MSERDTDLPDGLDETVLPELDETRVPEAEPPRPNAEFEYAALAPAAPLLTVDQLLSSQDATLEERTADGSAVPHLTDEEEEPGRPSEAIPERLGRYQILGEIGRGGMGRVFEAYDGELRRKVAVKVTRRKADTSRLARFVAEAQIASQLEHPSIVPVHDLGITAGGTIFYVMKRVAGRSLESLIRGLRVGEPGLRERWTRHRLLAAFLRVCQAVAYAHARGVLHRDLKPDNIMLGDFGEVLVLDWGVAGLMEVASVTTVAQRVSPELRATRTSSSDTLSGSLDTLRGSDEGSVERLTMAGTNVGSVIGTPGFMSPEQGSGQTEALDERSDVWSLGAILYTLLTFSRPYTGNGVLELITQSAHLPMHPAERAPHLDIPEALCEACLTALAPERTKRFANASLLAAEIEAFLEGSRRRQAAEALMQEAEPLSRDVTRWRKRARALEMRARKKLEAIPSWEPTAAKIEAWSMEDQARALLSQAEDAALRFSNTMQLALNHAPDYARARERLADFYREQHEAAEALRRSDEARSLEAMLRFHDRGRHTAYLQGTGALSLRSEPSGVEVEISRFVLHERRLVEQPLGSIGRTPLHHHNLEMGSYLLRLHRPGYPEVRYPVVIRRLEHWDGVPPGAQATRPVRLPERIDPGECFIPAGWFEAGGDAAAPNAQPRQRYWLDDFVMERHPVTNARYLEFLNDLLARGDEEDALRWAPRSRPGNVSSEGQLVYGREPGTGRFMLVPDADGDVWSPLWPVIMIDAPAMQAYTDWYAERTGLPWRLPHDLEWEKAARGVDGRAFPWGDFLDPTWCCMRATFERSILAEVTEFVVDTSPYGVRGLAGNVTELCSNAYGDAPEPGPRIAPELRPDWTARNYNAARGGAWVEAESYCRAARREGFSSRVRSSILGFRLARSL